MFKPFFLEPGVIKERILRPFQEFVDAETLGGIVLLVCIAAALLWANSPWSASYTSLWQTRFTIGVGGFALNKPLLLWINDGLMAIFFFLVGLEIKREVLIGELSTPRLAVLPILAALGGMLLPAAIYLLFNGGKASAAGWAIPMATDIAIALGMLSLLGKRIPQTLKVFLVAVAIVDDIGAVLVISLFYTSKIGWFALAVAGGFLLLLVALNRTHVRHPLAYTLFGVCLWVALLQSGVHATIAGVLIAMTIPAQSRIMARDFQQCSHALLHRFADLESTEQPQLWLNERQRATVAAVERACEEAQAPLHRMEHSLQHWVSFGILPLFALANAGVTLQGNVLSSLVHPVSLGIIIGLLLGKQLGITCFSWLAARLGLASLSPELSWRQVYGVSWFAGIGFTMSLFITTLAFDDPHLLAIAKIAILAAALLAAAGGWLLFRFLGPSADRAP